MKIENGVVIISELKAPLSSLLRNVIIEAQYLSKIIDGIQIKVDKFDADAMTKSIKLIKYNAETAMEELENG